jgi:hypothetical protein
MLTQTGKHIRIIDTEDLKLSENPKNNFLKIYFYVQNILFNLPLWAGRLCFSRPQIVHFQASLDYSK